ncbi:MAG: class I SAM-dependent rRNA methyltransferase [Bacteroidota bacterium]
MNSVVFLKSGREFSVQRFHPWIFSGGIQKIEGEPKDGDWVNVKDHKNKTLAYGHYQKGSITIRILSFENEKPGSDFWIKKVEPAYALRGGSYLPNEYTNCYRLVNAEGDGLPGLIIDIYNGVAVVQAHSAGMQADRQEIANALKIVFGETIHAIYYKNAVKEGTKESEYLFGMGVVPHIVTEHGNKFYVDWEQGQKTGFFLDQRENRNLLGAFSKARKVLNTFCYTGGFSVYALHAGAELVHSVDASEKAILLTRKNIELNGFDPIKHECHTADTFEFLKDKKDVYDVIILDPPAFAKHKEAKHQAMKGYQRLNAEAMRMVKSGGIIFTFSCSQVVDRQLFYDTIVSAAIQAGRQIKVLHHLSQPADHPVSIFHSEGEYLKGLVLYVE